MRQSCPLGLTTSDLVELFDNDEVKLARFNYWMVGQTMSICEGRAYNYEKKCYEPDECAATPHGIVVYRWDVERFLAGLPVID